MAKAEHPRQPTGRTNTASCLVATLFLTLLITLTLILYFTLFKPQTPTLQITAITLPSFSLLNQTLNLTLSQYAKLSNPNRASFTHYDSTLMLLYNRTQVGFMFIPAGTVDAKRTEYMAATFTVRQFRVPLVGPTMEFESRMEMAGKVRVLRVFTHRVRAKAGCVVVISVADGAVLGFHC